jgi:hypothetical protein
MFLDMAGYSAMMAQDEARAVRHVRALEAILNTEIPAAGGRLVKFMGDGSMAEFPSALSAVNCARSILRAIAAGYATDNPSDRYQVRIGLHLGEVREEGGDLLGDAVNIAARIQPLADPGGIAMSEVVFVQIKNQMALKGTFIPARKLKNIPEPVDVFLVAPEGVKYVKWFLKKNRGVRHGVLTTAGLLAAVVLALLGGRYLPEWLGPRRTISHPFPQSAAYRYGIKVSHKSSVEAASDIQKIFEKWRADRLTRKGAPSGTWRVVMVDDLTFSESIGYGMLILVMMDNRHNRTQDQFDGLWRYHQSFLDSNGLLNWQIDGNGKVVGANAGTSGELDAALALLLAHRQWGVGETSYYLTEARALVEKIMAKCVEPETQLLKPGDVFGGSSQYHPTAFSPAAIGTFCRAGLITEEVWARINAANFEVYDRCLMKNPLGFIPGTCDAGCAPVPNENDNFAAWPLLWRIGLGYLWYGEKYGGVGKIMLDRVTKFAINTTGGDPAKVKERYSQAGVGEGAPEWSQGQNSAYGVSAQAAGQQEWLNTMYDRVVISAFRAESKEYYDLTYTLLNLLAMTGNFPNFWDESMPDAAGGPPRGIKWDDPPQIAISRETAVSATATVVSEPDRGTTLRINFNRTAATQYFDLTAELNQNWTTADTLHLVAGSDAPRNCSVLFRDAGDELWEFGFRLSGRQEEYAIPLDIFNCSVDKQGRLDGITDLMNVRNITFRAEGASGTVWIGPVSVTGLEARAEGVLARAIEPVGFDAGGNPWTYSGNGSGVGWRYETQGADRIMRIDYDSALNGHWGAGINVEKDWSRFDCLHARLKSGTGKAVYLVIADVDGERWTVTIRPSQQFKDYAIPFNLFNIDWGKPAETKDGKFGLDKVVNVQVSEHDSPVRDTVWVASLGVSSPVRKPVSMTSPDYS